MKIRNYEAGKQDEEHLFEVSQKGAEKSYVEFLSPREKGQHLLMLGDDMWIYLPDTSRPVRITPLERLTGNASNGDVARTHYATDYDATFLRTETVNGASCHVLELTAQAQGFHLPPGPLLAARLRCPAGEGGLLRGLGQTNEVGDLSTATRKSTASFCCAA